MSNVCEDYVKIIEEKEEKIREKELEEKEKSKLRVASHFISFKNSFEEYTLKRENKRWFKFRYTNYRWFDREFFDQLLELVKCHINTKKYYIDYALFGSDQYWFYIKRVK